MFLGDYTMFTRSTKRGEKMGKINTEKDLVIVPVAYFEGMKSALQEFANLIEIHDLDAMEQLLDLREWMDSTKVDKEARKQNPNLRWNNIHLLLPQEKSCHTSDSQETECE